MRKILLFTLIFATLIGGVGTWLSHNDVLGKTSDIVPSAANYLVLGIDDVGVNSDVILLVGYKSETKVITVMQLPRDTYFEQDGEGQRVNQVYASFMQETGNKETALENTANILSTVLQVPINGAVAFNIPAFSEIVDAIGGVPINIPFAMKYRDDEQGLVISLPKGETVLDGKTAEQFVRFRSTYVEGDIGRLDAQKRFMAAFFKQAMGQADLSTILSCFMKNQEDITLSFDLKNATKMLAECVRNRDALKISFLSIPGEAVYLPNMGWRYAINHEAARTVLNSCFSTEYISEANFDPSGALCAEGNDAFENIYYSRGFEYKIYTQENVEDIKILEKE